MVWKLWILVALYEQPILIINKYSTVNNCTATAKTKIARHYSGETLSRCKIQRKSHGAKERSIEHYSGKSASE